MAAMEYTKMARILTRCAEIAESPSAKLLVKTTYVGVLELPADTFLNAQRSVTTMESSFAKETSESAMALDTLDQPYRETRSVVLAFVPTINVPMTLKQLPTDTDRINAIETLFDLVNSYKLTTWGIDLANGAFMQKAAACMNELAEAIEANKQLGEARKIRAAAFDPAYEAYMRFKRVVRDVHGATSIEYKRIHLRTPSASISDSAPPSTPG